MAEGVFGPDAHTRFRACYPEQPVLLDHGLRSHPLFELPEILRLAARMPPQHVEHNLGALPIGIDPGDVPANGLSVTETIRSIAQNGSWMVLKFVQNDPAYRALLQNILRELAPVVEPVTGKMLRKEGFIFISSPGAITPFHFDPEHNVLIQLRGAKTMTIFPAGDARFADGREHERFHLGGHRNLPFDPELAGEGRDFILHPGRAVYVPVKAPHFVRNGREVSISFSITWRSEWSFREADAHAFNALLRKSGITPGAPWRFPRDNHLKSLAYRSYAKLQRALRRSI